MTFTDAIWTIDYKDGHEHTAYRTGKQMQTIYDATCESEDGLFITGFGKDRYHCERCEKAYVPDMYTFDNTVCLDCKKVHVIEKVQCVDCGSRYDNPLDYLGLGPLDAKVIVCNACANKPTGIKWELIESSDTHSFYSTYHFGIIKYGFALKGEIPTHTYGITSLDAAKRKAMGIVSKSTPFGGIEMFRLGR